MVQTLDVDREEVRAPAGKYCSMTRLMRISGFFSIRSIQAVPGRFAIARSASSRENVFHVPSLGPPIT